MCPSDPALFPTVSLVMTPWIRVPFSTHTCTGEQDIAVTPCHSSQPHLQHHVGSNHNTLSTMLPVTSPTPASPTPTHLCVSRGNVLVGATVLVVRVTASSLNEIHSSGDDEREQLLPSPHWLGLHDGWERHLPVPARQPHQQVHHVHLQIAGTGTQVAPNQYTHSNGSPSPPPSADIHVASHTHSDGRNTPQPLPSRPPSAGSHTASHAHEVSNYQ